MVPVVACSTKADVVTTCKLPTIGVAQVASGGRTVPTVGAVTVAVRPAAPASPPVIAAGETAVMLPAVVPSLHKSNGTLIVIPGESALSCADVSTIGTVSE